jgi:hypothetical protein
MYHTGQSGEVMAKVQAFNTQPFGNVFVFLISTRVRAQHPHHRTRTHAHPHTHTRTHTHNDPAAPLKVVRTGQAGGLGLNLTGASRVVLFEPCWNPTNNIQALSRVRFLLSHSRGGWRRGWC